MPKIIVNRKPGEGDASLRLLVILIFDTCHFFDRMKLARAFKSGGWTRPDYG